MTTFGPPPFSVSLFERLVGAQVVLLGRVQGLVEQWSDPCEGARRRFGLLDVEVRQTLKGDVADRILVRVAGSGGEKDVEWSAPVDEAEDVLFLLDEDEEGDPPRYCVQYGSAFRLREDVLEVPEDLPLGVYAKEPGRLSLESVEQMLEQIEAAAATRHKQFEEVDGGDWAERPYPEVEEVGDPLADELPPYPPGPREGQPSGAGRRATRKRQ
jgi:hypothetical protein